MNLPEILLCLSILFYVADIQAQSHSPEQLRDSIPLLIEDSTFIQRSDSLVIHAKMGKEVLGQQDSIRTKADKSLVEITSDKFFAPSYMFNPSPQKAVIYSAIFPGLGQIYNRKYWKLPIVYGAFVGLTYGITWNNGYYRDYLGAYQDIMDDDPVSDRWENLLPYGQTAETVDTEWFTGVLKQRKDYFRYYRDLSIIATAGVYLLFIIDAYVDAQLFNFDMRPDLSMRMTPVIIKENSSHQLGSSSYGVQLSFNF